MNRGFYLVLKTALSSRHLLCINHKEKEFIPTFNVSPAFSKAADSKDGVFGRSAHGAKSLFPQKRRRGDKTVRWTVSAWGTLAGGSPVRAGAQRIAARAAALQIRAGRAIISLLA